VDIRARGGAAAASGIIMSEMIREDLGGKGVGSEESVPLSEKDDESPFFGRFLYWTFSWTGLYDHVWNRMEQAFLDGCSSILDSV
jgi:hypothetical protein